MVTRRTSLMCQNFTHIIAKLSVKQMLVRKTLQKMRKINWNEKSKKPENVAANLLSEMNMRNSRRRFLNARKI